MENCNTWTIKWLIFRQFFGQPIQCDAGAVSEHLKSSQTRCLTKYSFIKNILPSLPSLLINIYVIKSASENVCIVEHTQSPKKLKLWSVIDVMKSYLLSTFHTNTVIIHLTRNTSTYSRNVITCGKYLATLTLHCIDLFCVWRPMEGWRRRC